MGLICSTVLQWLHRNKSICKYNNLSRAHSPLWAGRCRFFNSCWSQESQPGPGIIPPKTDSPVGDISAMRELQSYRDRELRVLGIFSRSIPKSFMFGREGIERNSELKVA